MPHRLGRSAQHLLTLPHGLGWSQSEPDDMLSVSISWESFSEDVGGVALGGNSLERDGAELQVLPSEVVLDVDVFSSSVVLGVVC